MNSPSEKTASQLKLLQLVCAALDDKKADDLRVLYVGEQSSITDFLVLATGTSEPHLRALRVELEKVIDATGTRILGMDKDLGSGWVVIDAFDVMIHVFTPENRQKYAMENLWKDGEELSLDAIIKGLPITLGASPKPKKKAAPAKKPAPKKAAAKKPAAAKKTAAKKATSSKKPAAKRSAAPKKKPSARGKKRAS